MHIFPFNHHLHALQKSPQLKFGRLRSFATYPLGHTSTLEKQLLKYMEIVRDLATRCPGPAFQHYDSQFRLFRASVPLPWDRIHTEFWLMASTLSTNTRILSPFVPQDPPLNVDHSPQTVQNVSWTTYVGTSTNQPTVNASTAPTLVSVVSAGDPTLLSTAHSPARSRPPSPSLARTTIPVPTQSHPSNYNLVTPVNVNQLIPFLS
ncbi:hypothetical protein DPMN_025735 [Dreissena polymorpha]|uniref:Uncharacterized protein n=1 Tax=Dreissena polymorpha TaxID=45954 RepID=A0A9D4LRL6_DREPO|nr:hypothetical protein DPMN_025735 [Dreissena polymorpha]